MSNSKSEKPLEAEALLNQIHELKTQKNKEENILDEYASDGEKPLDLGPEIEIVGQIFGEPNPLVPLSTDSIYFKDPTTAAVVNATLKMSLRNFFQLCLSTTQFSNEIHTQVKDYDISVGTWSMDESKQYWMRTLTFKTPVDSKFVKQPWADVTQVQRLILKSKKELLMDTTNTTAGVPFAEAFTVEAKFRVVAEQEKLLKLQIYVEMNWKKSINFLMKSAVEKGSINGASAMLKQWGDLAKQKLALSSGKIEEKSSSTTKLETGKPEIKPRKIGPLFIRIFIALWIVILFLMITYYHMRLNELTQKLALLEKRLSEHTPTCHDELPL